MERAAVRALVRDEYGAFMAAGDAIAATCRARLQGTGLGLVRAAGHPEADGGRHARVMARMAA